MTDNTPKERIRELMYERRETYETLGKEIGVTSQAVSDVVNGKTTRATSRYALAKALNVNVEDIWPETEAVA